jgi:basic membrane lipoprotein Med (substrate-binding protein (PBP1-ABC) superfamily)/uncharacterized caspase-like protein
VGRARSALIVATDEYDDPGLSRLRAPAQDAEALAGVLRDARIGSFDVRTIRNEPAHVVSEAVEEFFDDRAQEDLLLLHFSCHGVKDEDGELYFATRNTKLRRLGATAVAAEFVNRRMNRSRSRRVVLLLDCCYAGAFERGMASRGGAAVDINERFGGRGRVVITASSALEYAFEGEQLAERAAPTPSVFTSALVQGLETGEADLDQDGMIALDELYEYVYDKVRNATPNQTPGKWTYGVQGELYIARRSHPVTTATALPPELEEALDHPLSGIRAGAVQELERLLRGRHEGRSLAARLALERLAGDDSRAVATAARAALAGEPPPTPRPAPAEPPPPARPQRHEPGDGPPPQRRLPGGRRGLALGLLGAGIAAVAVAVVALSGGSPSPKDRASLRAAIDPAKVALIMGKEDSTWNSSINSAAAALKSKHHLKIEQRTPNRDQKGSDRSRILDELTSQGYGLVIDAIGYDDAARMTAVATKRHPAVFYAPVEDYDADCDHVANLVCIQFELGDGAYIAGAAAALASSSRTVGFVGPTPDQRYLYEAYRRGASSIDSGVEVLPAGWVGGYDDEAKAKRLAQGQIDAGADVLYGLGGEITDWVVQAGIVAKTFVIGDTANVYRERADQPGRRYILTSIVHDVQKAASAAIDLYEAGSLKGGDPTRFGRFGVDGGVLDYAKDNTALDSGMRQQLDDVEFKIAHGDVESVPAG